MTPALRTLVMALAVLCLAATDPRFAAAQEVPAEASEGEAGEGESETDGAAEDAAENAAGIISQAAYDESLNRLGEIHGALFHLDALCRPGRETVWRTHMEAFLTAQRLGDERSGRLIARFNTGYRDYAATHRACTPAARELSRRFAREGITIASDLAARYGD